VGATRPADTWAVGAAYDAYVGRWSRLVAAEFVEWLPVAPGQDWLDVGCGTGVLTRAILAHAAPRSVVGIDPAEGFLRHARAKTADGRARFEAGSAQALPVDAQTFDAVVCGLVLNFVPDPAQGLAEMVRAVRPGGTVAAYVWDHADQMQLTRYCWDAVVALNPAAAELDEGRRFPICRPAALTSLFEMAGLVGVTVRAIDVPTVFRNFDDYWSPFLGGQGPAPSYIAALDEVRRVAVRERIRAELPIAGDGSIQLIARAWAIRGTR
jgi:SAM-dependent methyltransferase